MKFSFSVELARSPNIKTLTKQLDKLSDEFIKEMETSRVAISPYGTNVINDAATQAAEPSRKQIPVVDGNVPIKKPRMTAKRKAAIAAEEAAAKREAINDKRRAKRAANKEG